MLNLVYNKTVTPIIMRRIYKKKCKREMKKSKSIFKTKKNTSCNLKNILFKNSYRN